MTQMTEIGKDTVHLQECVKQLQVDGENVTDMCNGEAAEYSVKPEACSPCRGMKLAPISARGMASSSAKAPRPHSRRLGAQGGSSHSKRTPLTRDKHDKHRPT